MANGKTDLLPGRGHWIDKEEKIYGFLPSIIRVCSNCDTEYESTFMAACCAFIPSDAFGAGDDTKFPICPCCGAKMDGKIKLTESEDEV